VLQRQFHLGRRLDVEAMPVTFTRVRPGQSLI
jgi:hypothetical protein